MVEVWQTYDSHFPDVNSLTTAQSTIASDLDAIASSALQSLPPVTDTPVPTSTSTGGPAPTATPTDTGSPAPTSTPTPSPAPTDTPTSAGTSTPPESTISLNPTVTGAVAGCGSDYYACATPTPSAPITFDTFVARAEQPGPNMAYELGTPGLSQVRMGSTVMLAVYFSLRNVPPQSHAVVQFQIQRGYGVHFYYQSSPMALGTLPNTYRVTVPFQPKSIGKDTFVARVSIGGNSRQTNATFRVVRSLTKVAGNANAKASTGQGQSAKKQTTSSAALTPVRASSFALPVTSLASGTQIRQQGVEANQAAQSTLVPHLGSQSLTQLGRQTGFYLDAVQPNGGHAIDTQYLVSIFGTPAQAALAFNQQRAGYARLTSLMPSHYTSPASHRGFGTMEGFGTSLIASKGKPFYTREEFFARGRVFVQVVQSYFVSDSNPYGRNARSYLWSISHKLDALARSSQ